MTKFIVHTIETAPEKSKEVLKSTQGKLGFIPNVLGEMAESPALLRAYSDISAATASGSFSLVELQIIQLTASSMNNCSYCVAAHTTLAEKGGVPRNVLEDLRNDRPLKDKKLEALRIFTLSVIKKMGWAEARDLDAFFKAGYTKAHVMEVILSLSLKMITNYVNHIAATPLDKAFEPNRVTDKKTDGKASHAA